ncbi:MAG: glycerate kinase, partial [Clostridia bacterium]|nr:glycerate kinase [Clostridia bacterium]
QKGANPDMVKQLDAALAHFAKLSAKVLGEEYSTYPGTGAAGGLGFALIAYCKAKFAAGIDIVLNLFSKEEIAQKLAEISDRDCIKVMIHEQYFYEDYRLYQPEFEEKLHTTFSYLCGNGCQSSFFESLIP